MAHLPTLSADQIAHPEIAEMLRATGDEMFSVYGHAPEAFSAFLAFYRPLKYGGRLPFALKELVRLRIAALNGCHRWQQAREPSEKAPGLYDALLPKLGGTAARTDAEQAALDFAERLATDHTTIDARAIAALRAHFSDAEVVELGLVTAAFLMLGRLHRAFGIAEMPAATHALLEERA